MNLLMSSVTTAATETLYDQQNEPASVIEMTVIATIAPKT